MAKRRRLTPARPQDFTGSASAPARAEAPSRPPIAQVAGDSAAAAALDELSTSWRAAREEGRLVVNLPLEVVETDHLLRDRLDAEEETFRALLESLRARGQQTPIEIVALDENRYGLISGWRRLLALKRLHAETGEARFAQVQALIRRPEDRAQAYLAMIEENEIRADLSFYERARIVAHTTRAGVFEDETAALRQLFPQASYARRSKIKSFLPLVAALDGILRHPARISERTGLALSKSLAADPDLPGRIAAALAGLDPADAAAEATVLMHLLSASRKGKAAQSYDKGASKSPVVSRQVNEGLMMQAESGRIVLTGARITPHLAAELEAWLRQRES